MQSGGIAVERAPAASAVAPRQFGGVVHGVTEHGQKVDACQRQLKIDQISTAENSPPGWIVGAV